ncbi:SDR family NAD(P)-dependent oxidoreductase [Granulicoccus sp. GXG6511]|uniref:SDR family NAD(P)-dependent oxidoreductase n=1 Tax=Granulicoccus sp. GXG6511 TaxID=3381351 RepID=UPI003D7E0940
MSGNWLALRGKVVAVTGGGSGIGESVALELAAVGAVPVALDLVAESAERVADVARQWFGVDASGFGVDVCDGGRVREVFAAIKQKYGELHGLVNAAGLLRAGELATLSQEDWDLTLRIDLTGCFLTSQAAAQQMASGGSIVHISSIAGSNPQPFSGAYSPSKAGLGMLSRQVAFEWGPIGVRSNVVSPGLVRTPMSEAFYQAPGVLEAREQAVPLRRIATPQDMADVALYLLSERSAYVTGQEIVVDGGFSTALMSFVPRPGFGD